jgi:hypothetical protein
MYIPCATRSAFLVPQLIREPDKFTLRDPALGYDRRGILLVVRNSFRSSNGKVFRTVTKVHGRYR